jgi:hypothetical protein
VSGHVSGSFGESDIVLTKLRFCYHDCPLPVLSAFWPFEILGSVTHQRYLMNGPKIL